MKILFAIILILTAVIGISSAVVNHDDARLMVKRVGVISIFAGLMPGLGFFLMGFGIPEWLFWIVVWAPPLLFLLSAIVYGFKGQSRGSYVGAVLCFLGMILTLIWNVVLISVAGFPGGVNY